MRIDLNNLLGDEFDTTLKDSIAIAVGEIKMLRGHTVTIDFSNCFFEYPVTCQLMEAILDRVKDPASEIRHVVFEYNFPYDMGYVLNSLFYRCKAFGLHDRNKPPEIDELAEIVNRVLKEFNMTVSICIKSAAGVIQSERKYGNR